MVPQQDTFTFKDIFSAAHRGSLVTTSVLLVLAYICVHFANLYETIYATRATTTYVGDLLLDNLPVVNLNLVIVEGALLGIAVGCIFLYVNPRYILFTLKTMSLLVITRAFFVSLTHIGIYHGEINPGVGALDGLYTWFNLQTGYFFSGHTALPFMMGLIFWKKKVARVLWFTASFVFAASVLLAHIHYSIDVFAAPFITYGIVALSKKFFPHDYALIEQA